jgi:anti-anti-sigma factor
MRATGKGASYPSPTANSVGAAGRGRTVRKATIFDHRIHYNVLDGCAIVRPEGACDAQVTEALAKLVNSSMLQSRNLVIDLSHCAYVETPGYRWLVRQLRQLESDGRELIVAGMPPAVERVFKLLHFDRMIPTAQDVPDALKRLHGQREPAVA